jgi:hypothetical protein
VECDVSPCLQVSVKFTSISPEAHLSSSYKIPTKNFTGINYLPLLPRDFPGAQFVKTRVKLRDASTDSGKMATQRTIKYMHVNPKDSENHKPINVSYPSFKFSTGHRPIAVAARSIV